MPREKPTQINEKSNEEDFNDFPVTQHKSAWKSYSNPYDEILKEARLDDIQAFSDEHFWNLESDLPLNTEQVSEDYLDYLLGFE